MMTGDQNDDASKPERKSAHGHRHKYTVVIAADSAHEAIEVAAEALPRGASIIASDATPTGTDMGWAVTLTFTGGDRRTNDPVA